MTPSYKNQPQAATSNTLAKTLRSTNACCRVDARGTQEILKQNRPTRVPASSVVRIKSDSNMMAKWYHKERGRAG